MSDEVHGILDPQYFHRRGDMHRYKVKTGDSIKSLADSVGISWQDLAILNWGTCEPDEINWYLEHFVGCTKKSGANFLFSSSDDPGIIWLPQPQRGRPKRQRMGSARVSRYPVERG